MPGFNINEFISQINKSNVSKSANFKVQVIAPQSITNKLGIERDIIFRIDSAVTTGRNIQTTDYALYGLSEKIGYDTIYNPLEINVILSEDLREKDYFEDWQSLVVGPYNNNEQNTGMFTIGYYDNYIGTVIIRSYDDTENITHYQKFIEAYPINVGDISRSWEGGSEIMKLPVTFAYRFSTNRE